jgi:hypothetical protein
MAKNTLTIGLLALGLAAGCQTADSYPQPQPYQMYAPQQTAPQQTVPRQTQPQYDSGAAQPGAAPQAPQSGDANGEVQPQGHFAPGRF